MKLVVVTVAIAAAFGSVDAAPKPKLQWWKLPADKYKCTRYSPGTPSSDLVVYAPPGKPMIFSIGARAGRDKVSYRADGLPAGATIDGKTGRFSWSIPATATGTSKITLFATTASSEISSAFELRIADADLVAAWRAGMGSMTPDCTAIVSRHEFVDLDGDGVKDLAFTITDPSDNSATGTHDLHLRRRVGAKFDTVSRVISDGDLEVVKTPDNKSAVAITRSCCCMDMLDIYRVTPTGLDTLLSVSNDACGADSTPAGTISIETDQAGRAHRVETTSGKAWRYRQGTFVAE